MHTSPENYPINFSFVGSFCRTLDCFAYLTVEYCVGCEWLGPGHAPANLHLLVQDQVPVLEGVRVRPATGRDRGLQEHSHVPSLPNLLEYLHFFQCRESGMQFSGSGSSFEFSEFRMQAKVPDPTYINKVYIEIKNTQIKFNQKEEI